MDKRELDYDLSSELIAQSPTERRDASRLLVYTRATGAVAHRTFHDLPDVLPSETLCVVNDTRVVAARIPIERPRGEVLLLEQIEDGVWEALARPTRRLRPGTRHGQVELLEHLGEGRWRVRLHGEPAGRVPLPPYITQPLDDAERYQTVYAREQGSAAAPTAGLHFTSELLGELNVERVTLHVGLDTFRPLQTDRVEEHTIHGERYAVRPEAWSRIEAAPQVLAVGTTTVRVLETVARGLPADRPDGALHHAGLRVPARRSSADELPPAALDAPRARDGVRRDRGGPPPLRARDRGALPLLLLRRCDADPVNDSSHPSRNPRLATSQVRRAAPILERAWIRASVD